jgi:L-amino acid N-acyltransferase
MELRDATSTDVPAISGLYNATVSTTTVAWTEDHESVATRQSWLEEQWEAGHPVLVAEVDGHVVGFAAYDDFRNTAKWPGYRFTVEHTIHVSAEHQSAGVGSLLLQTLLRRAMAAGKHAMIGAIDGENEGSIRFHERHGFVQVARLPEVGFKFGHWLDLVLMQRRLPS